MRGNNRPDIEDIKARATIIARTYTLEQTARITRIVCLNDYMNPATLKGGATRGSNHLKHKYGMTKLDVIALLVAQDGKCDICGIEFVTGWDIDHNEQTGRVRGICCARHNRGLGQIGGTIPALKAAIEYLTRHGET